MLNEQIYFSLKTFNELALDEKLEEADRKFKQPFPKTLLNYLEKILTQSVSVIASFETEKFEK